MNSVSPQPCRDEVRFFWVGPPLSFYEILSLKSFLGTGARVVLYAYDSDLRVPDGVELHDAADVLPIDVLHRYNAGHPDAWARHSDLFRYVMLEKFGGWYADLDVVCLADRLPATDMYFGRAGETRVFAGLLKFPKGFPALREIIQEAEQILPEAAGEVQSHRSRAVIGTPLLSRVLKRYGLDGRAAAMQDAYAVSYQEALSFFDPAQCEALRERLEGSTFTHLWNSVWNRLRIPRDYGPPCGSFLDLLFARFGVNVPEQGRLSYELLASWVMEDCILDEYKQRVGDAELSGEVLDSFIVALRRDGFQPRERLYRPRAPWRPWNDAPQSAKPQTVRTFWHGTTMPLYQRACLQSFARHGHRVEVLTYQKGVSLADGLYPRDAREIVPEADVLRPLPDGRTGIHANLLRYALLERLGGWWIDPDVMLMQPDLLEDDVYIASPDVFGRTPVVVLKFPPGHPLMVAARQRAEGVGNDPAAWERTGAGLLSELVSDCDILSQEGEGLGPISWLNVPDLFDPGKRGELRRTAADARFVHLQDEVWRRAGIPSGLAPPEGCYLAELLERQGITTDFSAAMTFDQVNRWVRHMYRAAGLERA
jgi:mannosyltransferase OCH1-like enzyme